jgi:4-azaleucine resistance transporter AzlC
MNLFVHAILHSFSLYRYVYHSGRIRASQGVFLFTGLTQVDANSGPPRIKKLSYRTLFRSANETMFDTKNNSRKETFWAGFGVTMALWLGVAPFGAIYAVSALAAGLSPTQTLAMSLFVFAGASQFTATGLFAAGVAPATIVITTLVINARHTLLAASLAPFVRHARPATKALLAFQLTDESYAIGMRRWLAGGGSLRYQFGSNISLYVIWQASTVAGMLLGALIPNPSAYGLELVFPLTFIGLLVPILKDRMSTTVAALAAALAIAGALLLPGSWYILIAGIVASGVGAFLDRNQ